MVILEAQDFRVYNLPFLLVGFLWALFVLIIVFFVSDLSKENDKFKRNFENNYGTDCPNKGDTKKKPRKQFSTQSPSKSLFTDPRVNFILLLTFVCGYFAASFNAVQMPTISRQLYHIPVHYIGMIFNLEAVAFGLTMYITNKVRDDDKVVYFIVFGMCFMIAGLQSMSVSVLFYHYRTIGVCFLLTFAVCNGVGWSSEQVYLVVLLGRIVPSDIQGYAAGVRRTAFNFSCISGAVFTPLLHRFIFEHIFVLSVCIFLLVTIFLCQGKVYIIAGIINFIWSFTPNFLTQFIIYLKS